MSARLGERGAKSARALIPFITAGDPDLDTTAELILAFDKAGAAILELGIPFSDPMADGPVIQRASERALANGVTIGGCLTLVSQVRKKTNLPIVLFSYLNPLLSFGLDRLAEQMERSGADGLLITDLTPEEAGTIPHTLGRRGLDLIFLVAPTSTDDRLARICREASGFIYAVSRTGVTGIQENLSTAAARLVGRVRRFTSLPVAVGFGISRPEQVQEVWGFADAVVVGSALVSEIERCRGSTDLVERVTNHFRWLQG